MRQEKRKKRGGEEAKSKFCFLHMPELHKLIFCISIRRLQSVQQLASKQVFWQNLQGQMGKRLKLPAIDIAYYFLGYQV